MTSKALFALMLVLSLPGMSFAQKISVSGTVYEPDGEPAIGASIVVAGQNTGSVTDVDGNYVIQVDPNGKLTYSYIGCETQTIDVKNRTHIDVRLANNATVLNEVVAIGYGTVKKSDATGSVATVKPSEIEAGLATTTQDLLVGASPGVVVTTNGGDPSGSASITIRGGASLAASNDPLIVIDGVPMDTKGIVGASNPLALVSPENIESMSILKGASAAAIYGSRASNGVIIITTKKGLSGRPQVNFTMNGYINTTRTYLDVMSPNQFRNFIIDRYGAESTQAGQLGDYNTNWQKEGTRTTFSSDYSLSVGGTAGFLPYRVAVSYTDNNGILKGTGMDRVTGSVNLTPKFFDDLLSINANVKGAYIKNAYSENPMGGAVTMNPTIPVKNPNGDERLSYWTTYNGAGEWNAVPDMNQRPSVNFSTAPKNPIAQQQAQVSDGTAFQSTGSLEIDLKMPFLRELRAHLNLGYDYQHGKWKGYALPFTPAAWNSGYPILVEKADGTTEQQTIKDGGTSITRQKQTRKNLLLDFYLNYNKTFDAIRTAVDLTAGYSWQKFHNKKDEYSVVYCVGDPANEKYLGMQAAPTTYTIEPHQLVSFFARANFVFNDKYLLTATVRRDGTSRFSKENRWGTFPSFAIGWKLLEEDFMEPLRGIMNELKIRADYGVTGQQDLNNDYFPYLRTFSIWTGNTCLYPNLLDPNGAGMLPVQPNAYNDAIKWEETHTWGAGVDFGFMNNRINGSIDFYRRKTKDLLTNAPYPAGSNLSNQGNMNIGDLINTGLEFNIIARPIDNREITWTTSYNIGWNRNKITRLAEGATARIGNIDTDLYVQNHIVGYPSSSFFVYEQVYDQNGDPLEGVFVDRNGDGEINDADKHVYHSPAPEVTMNWSNTVNWRNWDFGITLRANIGNWVYNGNMCATTDMAANNALPLSNLMKGTFLFENISSLTKQSDYFVQNASFVRCDNITVGYTWDNLLKNTMRLRLYGAVQNPFVITKYKGVDPEVYGGIDNGVYPRPVTVSFGVVAQF